MKKKNKKKSPLTLAQERCDKLLTPIIKVLKPNCLLCGRPTEVAHHHVHKSKSNALRYDFDNLINLCHSCHFALHRNESYYASKIVKLRGMRWFDKLEKKKQNTVKVSIQYYKEMQESLKKKLEKSKKEMENHPLSPI